MSTVAVLTERIVRDTLRDDLPFAILAPAGNFIIFNLALRNVIDTGGIGYPQYLLPVIIVQVTLPTLRSMMLMTFYQARVKWSLMCTLPG